MRSSGCPIKAIQLQPFVIGQLQLDTINNVCTFRQLMRCTQMGSLFAIFHLTLRKFLAEIGQTYKLNFLGFHRMSLKLGEVTDLNIPNNLFDSDFFVFNVYWPSFVFVRTSLRSVRTATTSGQYSPVLPSRSISKRLIFV